MTKENNVDLLDTTVADAVIRGTVRIGSEVKVTAIVTSIQDDDDDDDIVVTVQIAGKKLWALDGRLPIQIVQRWHTVKSIEDIRIILNKLPISTKVVVRESEDATTPKSVLEVNWTNLLERRDEINFKVCGSY